jgi:hypothetical protein
MAVEFHRSQLLFFRFRFGSLQCRETARARKITDSPDSAVEYFSSIEAYEPAGVVVKKELMFSARATLPAGLVETNRHACR